MEVSGEPLEEPGVVEPLDALGDVQDDRHASEVRHGLPADHVAVGVRPLREQREHVEVVGILPRERLELAAVLLGPPLLERARPVEAAAVGIERVRYLVAEDEPGACELGLVGFVETDHEPSLEEGG